MFKKVSVALALPIILNANILQDLDEIVMKHPDIKTQMGYYNSVLADIDIAKSGYRPTLDVEGSIGREDVEYDDVGLTDSDDTYKNASVQLRQNLFEGFETEAEIEQNEARLSSAAFNLLDTANNVALDAINAYLQVLKEEALTKLYEENVQNHEDIYAKIKETNDSGRGRLSEVQQTQSRLSLAYSNLITQQNNFQDTLTEYHYTVGRHFDTTNANDPQFNFEIPQDIDEAAMNAIQSNPVVKVMRSNIHAQKAQIKRAKSAMYPVLDAVAEYEWENDASGVDGDKETMRYYLQLRWNLYNGGADEAERAKGLAQVSEEEGNLNRMRRDIIKSTRLSYVSMQMLEKQSAYLETHVNSAKETLDSYQEEYNLGRRDLLAILDAQNEYVTARQALIRAQYDHLLSKFRLLSATVGLPEALELNIMKNVDTEIIKDRLEDQSHYSPDSLCESDVDPQNCLNAPVINIGYSAN